MEPTRALLEHLGHPDRHFASVHIGGTNGKGSVSVMAYEALRRTGARTGLYTSPHLVDVRERMVVCGEPISRTAFTMWTARLEEAVRSTGASFFEATTAIAFADFAARGVDVAVIEVGLGGRLDSTNVVVPLVSAVTSVAREHVEYLGSDLQGIAREKAAIAKVGLPFVIGESDPSLVETMVGVAREAGAEPIVVPARASYDGPLAMAGTHQRRNAAIAARVLEHLPAALRPNAETVRAGFGAARLPGRFDRRGRWIFDVAHNPAGVATLVAAMREVAPPAPIHAVVGILGDKEWRMMLTMVQQVAQRVWVTQPPTAPLDRRWDPEEAAQAVPGVVAEPDFDRALAAAGVGAASVLVTGSFHTVGDAMARLPGFRPLE